MFHTLRVRRRVLVGSIVLIAVGLTAMFCRGQGAGAGGSLIYEKAQPTDPIARLQKQIDDGTAALAFDKSHGYLPAVLKALGIPQSSQGLVFSKTSFQREAIAPWEPRAIYFNADTYVGWVQSGRVLEVASVDKDLGTVFYTLDQVAVNKPHFDRHTVNCLQCHDGSMTGGVPGLVVRSAFTDAGGEPKLSIPNYLTTSASPFSERWGGWYVTGTTGKMKHMGNLIVHAGDSPRTMNLLENADLKDLSGKVDTTPYLSPGSDVVALLVLTHQTQVHNLITKVAYEFGGIQHMTLRAKPAATQAGETAEQLQKVCEPLLEEMLGCNEVPLPNPVAGTTSFAKEFAAAGLRDKQGRSLRDLDLQTRVFKYPCSYLIDSDSFHALPAAAKDYLYRRLFDILTGKDTGDAYKHLTAGERAEILEILRGTEKDLPANWNP